jgi:hypothetical protein
LNDYALLQISYHAYGDYITAEQTNEIIEQLEILKEKVSEPTHIEMTKAEHDALEDPSGSGKFPSLAGKIVTLTDVFPGDSEEVKDISADFYTNIIFNDKFSANVNGVRAYKLGRLIKLNITGTVLTTIIENNTVFKINKYKSIGIENIIAFRTYNIVNCLFLAAEKCFTGHDIASGIISFSICYFTNE